MVGDPLALTGLIAALGLILFVTDWIRPAYTAIAMLVALVLTGVITPEQSFTGLASNATITVLCMFILAAAVDRTGIVNDLARWLMAKTEGRPRNAFIALLVLTGVVSAVLNNTPVVALMIPLVLTIARRLDESASHYLVPLSFVAMLGGTMTLVGTSGNLVGSAAAERLGYDGFGLFDFLPIAGPVFLLGTAFLALAGPRLLPARRAKGGAKERYNIEHYLAEVEIEPDSPLVGETLGSSDLRYAYDVEVLELHRGGTRLRGSLANRELRVGDTLVVQSDRDELVRLLKDQGLQAHEGEAELATEDDRFLEVHVREGSWLAGETLKAVRFRERFGAEVLAVKRGQETIRERLPDLTLRAADTLLVVGDQFAVERLSRSRAIALAEPVQPRSFKRGKAPIAVGVLLAVVAIGATPWVALPIAALTGVLIVGVTGCLEFYEVHEAVDWQVIVILACLIPFGVALAESGGTDWLASLIIQNAGTLEPVLVLGVVYAMTALVAQVITNAAAISVMVPVGARVGEVLGFTVEAFLIATILGGSAGFLTPIGYQTNLMVFGPGEYRFTDYARVGIPLLVLVGVATVGLLSVAYPLTG